MANLSATNVSTSLTVDSGTNLATAITGATVSNDTITFTRANGGTFAVTTSDADTNTWRPIDDTPVDGNTTTSISSNWAFDNVKTAVPANAVFTDTVNTDADTVDGLHASSFMQLNAGAVYVSSGDSHVKYKLWGNDNNYAIGMHSGMTVGAVADYATTFTMNDDTDRGWVWRHSGQAATAGVASMTAYGDFTAQTVAVVDGLAVGGTLSGRAFGANSTIGAATGYEFDLAGGGISCSGLSASGDVTAFSDRRLKENIKPIEGALDKVLKLEGVSYTRKDSDDKSTKIGFIAQDVNEVVPEVVSIQNREGAEIEDVHTVAYSNMIALLTEAMKEQQKQIEELKSQINALTK